MGTGREDSIGHQHEMKCFPDTQAQHDPAGSHPAHVPWQDEQGHFEASTLGACPCRLAAPSRTGTLLPSCCSFFSSCTCSCFLSCSSSRTLFCSFRKTVMSMAAFSRPISFRGRQEAGREGFNSKDALGNTHVPHVSCLSSVSLLDITNPDF